VSIVERLDEKSKPILCVAGFLLIVVVGLIDFLTGYEVGFSIFYVLPISLITWVAGPRIGIASAVFSAAVWLSAEITTGNTYSSALVPVWNTAIRLTFFVLITRLLAALRSALQRENELARIDHLTGAVNSRFFYLLAQREMDRFQRFRSPFTLVYLDLDNFKGVNDRFGHSAGDAVLVEVVDSIRNQIRKTDLIARLGGDEFVLLLPATEQAAARSVISKIRRRLAEEMQRNRWPVTCSIGVLTCLAAPQSIDELVRMADELMYAAKNEGKDRVRYSEYSRPECELGPQRVETASDASPGADARAQR